MYECVVVDCRHTPYHAFFCYRHTERLVFADE